MQSTGHSSMHALSLVSTQGWAMTYVTSPPKVAGPSWAAPGGRVGPSIADARTAGGRRGVIRGRCRPEPWLGPGFLYRPGGFGTRGRRPTVVPGSPAAACVPKLGGVAADAAG